MVEDFEKKYCLIPIKKDLIGSINAFFKDLLSKTALDGILIQQKLPNGFGFVPALITDPEKLVTANPLAPVMPINAAKAVSDYTRLQPSAKKIGVVLRPCESRALIELVKLKQANLENIIIIGIDCPGTIPIQSLTDTDDKAPLDSEALIKGLDKLEDILELRIACKACEYFTPDVSDITLGLYGLDLKKHFLVIANSESGFELLEPMKLSFNGSAKAKAEARQKAINKLKEKRLAYTKDLEDKTQKRIHGLDNFMAELSSCINCHNCMTVCPICYCKECFFESPTFDLESDKYLEMAKHKGSLRMPSNMFLFHVTRFNHMVLSCIACGMCEQGCPANIPLLSIYKTVGRKAQEVFGYEPGCSLDEEIPILTFQEDELEPK